MKSKTFLNEIKSLSVAELKLKKIALKEELMKLRFKGAVNQLEKGHLISELKKNVARVETVLKGKN
jgi:large subunit ribosomal protein L29